MLYQTPELLIYIFYPPPNISVKDANTSTTQCKSLQISGVALIHESLVTTLIIIWHCSLATSDSKYSSFWQPCNSLCPCCLYNLLMNPKPWTNFQYTQHFSVRKCDLSRSMSSWIWLSNVLKISNKKKKETQAKQTKNHHHSKNILLDFLDNNKKAIKQWNQELQNFLTCLLTKI